MLVWMDGQQFLPKYHRSKFRYQDIKFGTKKPRLKPQGTKMVNVQNESMMIAISAYEVRLLKIPHVQNCVGWYQDSLNWF